MGSADGGRCLLIQFPSAVGDLEWEVLTPRSCRSCRQFFWERNGFKRTQISQRNVPRCSMKQDVSLLQAVPVAQRFPCTGVRAPRLTWQAYSSSLIMCTPAFMATISSLATYEGFQGHEFLLAFVFASKVVSDNTGHVAFPIWVPSTQIGKASKNIDDT